MPSGNVIYSNLPLQIVLYINRWYGLFYFVVSFVLYIYKSLAMPYPSNYLAGEVMGLVLFMLVECCRLPLGSYGNKTEQTGPTLGFAVVSVASGIAVVYYLNLQLYVIFFDYIFSGIYLACIGVELFLSLVAAIVFYRHPQV